MANRMWGESSPVEKAVRLGVPHAKAMYLSHSTHKDCIFTCVDGYRWERFDISKLRGISRGANCKVIVCIGNNVEEMSCREVMKQRREMFAECKGSRFRKHGARVRGIDQSMNAGRGFKSESVMRDGARRGERVHFRHAVAVANRNNCFVTKDGARISKAFIILPRKEA